MKSENIFLKHFVSLSSTMKIPLTMKVEKLDFFLKVIKYIFRGSNSDMFLLGTERVWKGFSSQHISMQGDNV